MKTLLTTAAAVSLLAVFAGGASAQDQQNRGGEADHAGRPAGGEMRATARPSETRAPDHAVRQGGAADHATTVRRSTSTSQVHRTGTTSAHVNRSTTVTTHRTTTVTSLQRNVHATRSYQVAAYRGPPGYAYRQWGYGQRLPGAYYASNYWLTDFLAYGLIAPPSGLVWVRVGPDAMLIDRNNGQIIQARYGVFA